MRRLPLSSWGGRGGRGTVLSMLPPCEAPADWIPELSFVLDKPQVLT